MTLFSEKMLISHKCIHDLMPNFIKKSWTVISPSINRRTFEEEGFVSIPSKIGGVGDYRPPSSDRPDVNQ